MKLLVLAIVLVAALADEQSAKLPMKAVEKLLEIKEKISFAQQRKEARENGNEKEFLKNYKEAWVSKTNILYLQNEINSIYNTLLLVHIEKEYSFV